MPAWRDVDTPLNPQEGHRGYQIVDGGKDRKKKAAPQGGGSWVTRSGPTWSAPSRSVRLGRPDTQCGAEC